MTTSYKFLVIETKDWVVRIQKVWVEDNFDPIVSIIEEANTTNLIENGIVGIVCHVMGCDGREGVAFESEDASFQ
jgi:hypothetical protein